MNFPTVKEYDLIVYIGRFQPFHVAHQKTIDKALTLSNTVLVLVGSSENSTSPKNPFTYFQRKEMIQEVYNIGYMSVKGEKLYVDGIKDHTYDDPEWIREVGASVDKHTRNINKSDIKIGIIGHDKDESTFYLNYFPQWKYVEVPAFPEHGETIDATKIRNLLFSDNIEFVSGVVPQNVFRTLYDFYSNSDTFIDLQSDWKQIQQYKEMWAGSPYAVIFQTVDSIVIQSGHVLLIKRKESPGKNLWAIPGGFINEYETLRDAAIRELREETKLKIPVKVLKGSIREEHTFDTPNRSSRGRTITRGFLFELDDTQKLPRVKGSDDAVDAKWFPFSEFAKMESQMFEDHFHIVNHMLNMR